MKERYFCASSFDDDGKSYNLLVEDSVLLTDSPETKKLININHIAKLVTVKSIEEILSKCNLELNCFEYIPNTALSKFDNNKDIEFALKDKDRQVLFIFKNIDNGQFFTTGEFNTDIAEEYDVSTVEDIYLIFEKIDSLVIGYNSFSKNNIEIHVHPLKWFFSQYFSECEWEIFKNEIIEFSNTLNEYIGLSITKNFSDYTLSRFKRIIRNKLISHPYESILKNDIEFDGKHYFLPKEDFNSIKNTFINNGLYSLMIGNNVFAESFVTAEWLLDSMKKAKAIDLTVIAMGYFKSFEQLLYQLIKNINTNFSSDNTIGDMAAYISHNFSKVFDKSISPYGRNYIKQAIYKYKNIRNGFLHKDNIKNLDKIDEIQSETYRIIFLILGSFQIDRSMISNKNSFIVDDFDALGECIDFYRDRLLLVYFDEKPILVSGTRNSHINLISNKTIYEDIILKVFPDGSFLKITRNYCPEQIYLVSLNIQYDKEIKTKPQKSQILFSKGKYVGPDISSGIEFKY